jgi:hypothetical protein
VPTGLRARLPPGPPPLRRRRAPYNLPCRERDYRFWNKLHQGARLLPDEAFILLCDVGRLSTSCVPQSRTTRYRSRLNIWRGIVVLIFYKHLGIFSAPPYAKMQDMYMHRIDANPKKAAALQSMSHA